MSWASLSHSDSIDAVTPADSRSLIVFLRVEYAIASGCFSHSLRFTEQGRRDRDKADPCDAVGCPTGTPHIVGILI